MKTKQMLVIGKTKVFNTSTNDVSYYIKLSDNTQIPVSKEEFYVNIVGTELRLESKVEYKWQLEHIQHIVKT